MILINIWLFFLGAAFASFLNATLYRLDNGYKYPEIIKVGSHCENCKKNLKWWELIPIIGYFLIKGRCSKCGKKVNAYYPLSELLLGVIFVLFFISSVSWYLWITVLFLFILSYFDIKEQAVYKDLIHVFLVITLLFYFLFAFDVANLILPVIFSIMIIILNLVKKSFGFGDLLVLLGLGILITWQQYIVMFWLGIIFALLYSLVLLITKKIELKGAKIPMIPFFALSFVVAVLYGDRIYYILLNLMKIW
jgi:prepilin signal peptidase PulO-like enzyme (type II secretory pathway)